MSKTGPDQGRDRMHAAARDSMTHNGIGDVATPKPIDPGVLIVRTTAGDEFVFDAGTHTYDVWVNDKKRWRKVEITLHTDKGSWIVKTIDFPESIERRFSTPNAELTGAAHHERKAKPCDENTKATETTDSAASALSAELCVIEGADYCQDDEPVCLVCGGEGWVEGRDHLDWDEDGYDDLIECTSCHGSGQAKDMTWC